MNLKKITYFGLVISLGLLLVLPVAGFAGGSGTKSDTSSNSSGDGLFTDIPQDHWAYDDVSYLAKRGIITGLPSGQYNGDQAITRYQVATLVSRAVKYLNQNPQSVDKKNLASLEDLVFKLSDRVKSMNYSKLQSKVSTLEQQLNRLQQDSGRSDLVKKLRTRASNNFIIGVTGIVVGVSALFLGLITSS